MTNHLPFLPFLLLPLVASCLSYEDMGVSFHEEMVGFASAYTPNSTYESGYAAGQRAGLHLGFSLDMLAASARAFSLDPLHPMAASGRLTSRQLGTSAVLQNATLLLFPNGTSGGNTTHMRYYLPFVAADGAVYHLDGVKNIVGSLECPLHVEAMMTTLYSVVRRGATPNAGEIVLIGIVKIPLPLVVSLFATVRTVGPGDDADRVNALVEVFGYAAGVLEALCLPSFKDTSYMFWYVWASTGSNGFLLDLIQAPGYGEVRFDVYSLAGAPTVNIDTYPPTAVVVTPTGGVVINGTSFITPTAAAARTSNGLAMAANFSLSGVTNRFVPPAIEKLAGGLLPDVVSSYGSLQGAVSAGVAYPAGTPLTLTTYPIKALMDYWRWAMISAPDFAGGAAAVEIMATEIGGVWLATAYVRIGSQEHHLDDPLSGDAVMGARGEVSPDGKTRTFSAKFKSIGCSITCQAPVGQFAVLAKAGKTTIHTTVMGQCTLSGPTFQHQGATNKGGALLEVKGDH